MKRLGFIAALFAGVAKAQQWKVCKRDPKIPAVCSTENMPALNNQCPVCGTMAPPYIRFDAPMQPKHQLIGCERCRAAFFQEAV